MSDLIRDVLGSLAASGIWLGLWWLTIVLLVPRVLLF
jgi:hypothetical protein